MLTKFLTLIFIAISSWSVQAADDCIASCVNKNKRKGNACFQEMCKRGCSVLNGNNHLGLSDDGKTLDLSGAILPGDLQFDPSQPSSAMVTKLVLNSPGGDPALTKRLMTWVEKRGDSIKVVIPKDGVCVSACAEIFRCAKNREANKSAILMFSPSKGSERTSCAKTASTSVPGKLISENMKRNKEFCYRASGLGGRNGFLRLEGAAPERAPKKPAAPAPPAPVAEPGPPPLGDEVLPIAPPSSPRDDADTLYEPIRIQQ